MHVVDGARLIGRLVEREAGLERAVVVVRRSSGVAWLRAVRSA